MYWGHISVLDADLICLRHLLAVGQWDYFVNTAGTEMPMASYSKFIQEEHSEAETR